MQGSKTHYVDNTSQILSAGLTIRQKEPKNLEAPFDQIDSCLTPTELFYMRSYFPTPALDRASTHRWCGQASVRIELRRVAQHAIRNAGPLRPSPNDTTWRYLIAVDRKIGSDPATTQNNVSNPKTQFNGANRPAS
jgi:hypothetical protein